MHNITIDCLVFSNQMYEKSIEYEVLTLFTNGKFSEESPRHADLGQINVPQVCSQSTTVTAPYTGYGVNKMLT